ncbi:GIY-YIG nuclease family protein [Micromonospora sp. NPDC049801]|uniref:GIY-YIG nuclease family protein n=1 Tax=unclassified Micromonospora TaxID=2617518 RepID=UPI0033DADF4A
MRLHHYDRSDRTALYRLYSADGNLIYVGISYTPHSRVLQHRANQPWGGEITRQSIEWYENRAAAEAAEASAIEHDSPTYNVKPGHAPRDGSHPAEDQVSERLAEVVEAFDTIRQRERDYRTALRRALANGVQQRAIAEALGRTREMIRRDAMTEEQRDQLRRAEASRQRGARAS